MREKSKLEETYNELSEREREKLNSWIKDHYFSGLHQRDLINKSELEEVLKKMNTDLKKLI